MAIPTMMIPMAEETVIDTIGSLPPIPNQDGKPTAARRKSERGEKREIQKKREREKGIWGERREESH